MEHGPIVLAARSHAVIGRPTSRGVPAVRAAVRATSSLAAMPSGGPGRPTSHARPVSGQPPVAQARTGRTARARNGRQISPGRVRVPVLPAKVVPETTGRRRSRAADRVPVAGTVDRATTDHARIGRPTSPVPADVPTVPGTADPRATGPATNHARTGQPTNPVPAHVPTVPATTDPRATGPATNHAKTGQPTNPVPAHVPTALATTDRRTTGRRTSLAVAGGRPVAATRVPATGVRARSGRPTSHALRGVPDVRTGRGSLRVPDLPPRPTSRRRPRVSTCGNCRAASALSCAA